MFAIDTLNMKTDFTLNTIGSHHLNKMIELAFAKIAPLWPLKNIIAVNPLRGMEDFTFENAINEGLSLFEMQNLPIKMEHVNRQTIKWCQAYFDQGQATIEMPLRPLGLYQAFKKLVIYDGEIAKSSCESTDFIKSLPDNSLQAIDYLLKMSSLSDDQYEGYLLLLLASLPGWAGYIHYLSTWSPDESKAYTSIHADYIAIRMIITVSSGQDPEQLYDWYINSVSNRDASRTQQIVSDIQANEWRAHRALLDQFVSNTLPTISRKSIPDAQFVFCIDVRSEPMRKAIEAQGSYDTYGFAGFFGLPIEVSSEIDSNSHASCPVLITPLHRVVECIEDGKTTRQLCISKKNRVNLVNAVYTAMKYKFTSPFVLVDLLGVWSGVGMVIRTLLPKSAKSLFNRFFKVNQSAISFVPALNAIDSCDGIPFEDRCRYAESFLRTIGLTIGFSNYIFLCAHGAESENNAYHSALECGACGGYQGAPNARIMSCILNDHIVRSELTKVGIHIPSTSTFIPALHNTTTDELVILSSSELDANATALANIMHDLNNAKRQNNQLRMSQLPSSLLKSDIHDRSANWAEIRPEWGLANNTAFIIGQRSLTEALNLDGRAFLHSYDWRVDHDGSLLASIMNGPVIVAQWINCQYLFSSLNNVAYGSGSKITQNITGKLGVMQGNASDLLTGLPLQSVNSDDFNRYHEPTRLMVIINAPRKIIDSVLKNNPDLTKLFVNRWMMLTCINPEENIIYQLNGDSKWNVYSSLNQ